MNNDFTLRLGDKSQFFCHGRHSEQDFCVTLADTGLECMTGGRVKKVQRHIDGDTFLLTYGDGVSDVNISKLIAFHCAHGKLATVTSVTPTSRFGILEMDGPQVLRFAEKPKTDGLISAGYFVLNRKVFDYLGGDECVLEREPLERLAAEGQLMAYPHEGFFYAMDTYREYQHLNELWSRNAAPWKVWA
jgi:glucose-1-phosphate cytidylyltransferase